MKRVVEPVRKSLLDVVQKNLRAAGRITYITRVTYIGEYVGAPENLEQKMRTAINDLQKDYPNVPITGFFLVYPLYYVHVLEASGDIIYRHFKVIRDNESEDCELGRSIFLPFHHHINQRFFTEWFHVQAIPPTLLEKLESYELEDLQRQTINCLTKVYTLCEHIANTVRDYSVSMKDVVERLSDKVARYFPESTVLEYLLNARSPVLMTAEDYLETYAKVPFINLYQDSIWPPPRDFIFCGGCEKDNRNRSIGHDSTKDVRASHGRHH